MKLTQVKFEALFGYFNYSIEFNDSITIIHGPNGCGKTTMLKIIDAVFNKKLAIVKATNFKSVQFIFSTGDALKVERKRTCLDKDAKNMGFIYLAYTVTNNGQKQVFDTFENSDEYFIIIEKFLKSVRPFPWLERTSENTWYDKRAEITMSSEDVVAKYGSIIYKRYGKDLFEDDVPDQVQDILNRIDIRLIAADRLTVQKRIERQYGEDNIKIEQRVDIIAEDLSKKIREAIQKYAQLAQAKDRTFPLRAIKENSPMSVDQIKNKMIELESKRKELIDTGILEEEKDDIDIHELVNSITENNRQNLSLYAIDTEEKLNALSALSSSINLFRTLVDNSFNHKEIIFNKDYGFRFKTTYSNTVIMPQNLSSGEQHELVMFYDLIFNTTSNTIILIDEPELSLHIKWQLSYIDGLLSIIKFTGFSAVLATHSPQIINDKWDLTVSLSE